MKGIAKTVIYKAKDFGSIPKPADCLECPLHYQGCKDHMPLCNEFYDCRATTCNILGIRYQFMLNF